MDATCVAHESVSYQDEAKLSVLMLQSRKAKDSSSTGLTSW
jgi:hypothetical protein